MATIDNKYIMVDKEDLSFDVEITQQPVERGVNISDHVQRKARVLSISGVVSGNKAAEMHRYLVECQDQGKIVHFIGRTTMWGLLSGLSTSRDYTIADGFTYSVTITETLMAGNSYESSVPKAMKTQIAPVGSAGMYGVPCGTVIIGAPFCAAVSTPPLEQPLGLEQIWG